MMKVYHVKDDIKFVQHIAEYANGILTTGGLYKPEDLEEVKENEAVSITYNSESATELPIDWPSMYWLDDNDKRQKIKDILFGQSPAYVMEDGTISEEVTL